MKLPLMHTVRQQFPATPSVAVASELKRQFDTLREKLHPGMKVAVAVGSRGICRLAEVVHATIGLLKEAGAEPFILPAMGSHGGATEEGQRDLLAGYGVTEETMGAPVRVSMEVTEIGRSEDGMPVWCATEALRAEGILLINRIKPHTDFLGGLGSGLLKMSVVGLGKREGASAMHQAAAWLGYERCILGAARLMCQKAPLLGGIGIVENALHDIGKLAVIPVEQLEKRERELFLDAKQWMPRLPFEEIDLLVVDRIGKNISGTGMDPNVTGRWVHHYTSSLQREDRPAPFVRRIFVRDLTPETHGNATGIGLADITTTRLVQATDTRITYLNALTALSLPTAKIPIHFETDREAIEMILPSLALVDPAQARIVRIANTLSLGKLEISEALQSEAASNPMLSSVGLGEEWRFDDQGNLSELDHS